MDADTGAVRVRKENREPKRTVKLAKVRMNVCVVSKGHGLRRGRFSALFRLPPECEAYRLYFKTKH